MFDKKSVIIMSKMALYDKDEVGRDLKKYQYFRHDYIYRRNAWTRFFAVVGILLVAGLYVLKLMVIDELNPLRALADGSYVKYLTDIAVFAAVALVAYSVIGTIIGTAEYNKARKRIDEYFALGEELEALREARYKAEQAAAAGDEDEDEDYDAVRPYRPTERAARESEPPKASSSTRRMPSSRTLLPPPPGIKVDIKKEKAAELADENALVYNDENTEKSEGE